MWHQFNPNRGVALLLVLFVFQLGATGCRCLEHNGWLQTFIAAFADDVDDHGHSHPAVTTVVAETHHHGECVPYRDTYRVPTRGIDLTRGDLLAEVAYLADLDAELQCVVAGRWYARQDLRGLDLIVPARAEIQVFLL